jgi:hypothetical protein
MLSLFLVTNINNTISQFVMDINTPNSSSLYIKESKEEEEEHAIV